ncbi:polysaccharide lyase family 3 protein, partial [Lophiotrema nucula]
AATTTFPEAAGESTLSEPMSVTGEFDGGMVRFGRGVECGGQSEGGDSDAVFEVQEGGTLKNVIIGADQSEGIHCMGACTIENVWWEAVCEDALTIKQESGVSYVIGGGAKGAEDKVVQHNGGGTVNIQGFYVSDFGKLYRSCGNCDTMYERHVVIDGIVADGGTATLVGINSNYGDTATITNSCVTNTKNICEEFEGNDTGDEPTEISSGISSSCIYTDADIAAC